MCERLYVCVYTFVLLISTSRTITLIYFQLTRWGRYNEVLIDCTLHFIGSSIQRTEEPNVSAAASLPPLFTTDHNTWLHAAGNTWTQLKAAGGRLGAVNNETGGIGGTQYKKTTEIDVDAGRSYRRRWRDNKDRVGKGCKVIGNAEII